MNFYWNHFSPINLGIDLAVLITLPLFLGWMIRRSKSSASNQQPLRILTGLLLYSIAIVLISALPGISTFLRAHILWTIGSVLFPIAIVIYSVRFKRYAVLLLIPGVLGIKYYAEVYEPYNLEVSRFETSSPALKTEIRVAHISDLQTDGIKPMHSEARHALLEFDPDLIVFTGDVLNHKDLIPEVEGWLKSLNARHAYFVTGNVDDPLNLATFEANTGFEVMDAHQEEINIRGQRLGIIGLGLPDFRNDNLFAFLRGKSSSPYNILLSHYPDAMFLRKQRKIDILFAGHTHGGQIVIPGFGPIQTLSHVPRHIAAGGVHQVDDLTVVVSRGLGMEGHIAPRVRIFCRPQLILMTLKPETNPKPQIHADKHG
ncbi:MAG: metallophosphoesterase [Spirochaetia bacterium]|nr:metallophosphoesterase [Spirochaetia bacterium]